MPTGRLKNWLADRGFGFIEDDAGGNDVFVHINALRAGFIDPDELKKGDQLTYEIGRGRDGRASAENVRRAK